MRAAFGIIALLLVLVVVALLARHQLTATQKPLPQMAVPSVSSRGHGQQASAPLNAAQQSQQIQQQIGDSVNQMMKQRTEQLDQQEQKQP